jgi:tight adherence protein B
VVLAAGLAGASAGLLVALPRPGALRLRTLQAPVRERVRVRRPRWALVAAPAVLLLGPVPAILAVLAAVVAVRWSRSRTAARAAAAERTGAVEACGALAAELRAGRSPSEALAAASEVAAGPCQQALAAAAAAARLGGDVPAALTAEGTAVGHVLRSLGACWTVCARSGSGLAAAVERLEEGLRADQAQRRAVDAELAGPRATAGLLAVLPVIGLLMAAGLGADPVHVLLATPLGLLCLVLGLGLDGLGVLWTGRLVRRAGGT